MAARLTALFERLPRLPLPVVAGLLLALAAGAAQAQPFGQWLRFTGHPAPGYVEVPHSPALNPARAITVEAWVSLQNNPGTEDCRSIAGKNWQEAWWIGVCNVAGQPTLRSFLKGVPRNGGTVGRAELTHVALVYNGTHRLHYINGELAASFPEAGPLSTSTAPLRIGSDVAWQFTPGGLIDEVRLWNVARTTAQIRAALNQPIHTPQPGLVAVWSLDNTDEDVVGPHDGDLDGSASYRTFLTSDDCGDRTETALCLRDHFVVTAFFRTNPTPGSAVDGQAHTVASDNPGSGIFWFFTPDNWEVMVKVLDGCSLNDRFWFFSAATTNLFYRVEVIDLRNGGQKIYFNYPGPPAPAVTDTSAFATCP